MRIAHAMVFVSALTLVGVGGCGSGSLPHAGTGGVDGTGTGGAQAGSSGAGDTGGAQAGTSGAGNAGGAPAGTSGAGNAGGSAGDGGSGGAGGFAGTGGGAGAGATGGGGGTAGSGGGAGRAALPGDPCTVGDTTCIRDMIYACPSGTWGLRNACDVNTRCVTSGSTATCQCYTGSTTCHQNMVTLLRCNADGTWDSSPCGPSEVCSINKCTTVCSAGWAGDCLDITTRRACVNSAVVAVRCTPAEVCSLGQCVPNNT